MSTIAVKRRTLTESINSIVRNAEKQFPAEQDVTKLVNEVQLLILNVDEPVFRIQETIDSRIQETIDSVINRTSSDALIIMMRDVEDLFHQIEELNKLKRLESDKRRAFLLHDLITMNRERLEIWTNEWENAVWSSDNEHRVRVSNTIFRIQKDLESLVHEFESVLSSISDELRAEWAKDYFGR